MIPFLDLQAQYRGIKDEIDQAVLSVLASGQFALGPEVAAFEREFASYCDSPHAVAVNTGTSALHLALLAAGVGPGDEVITVPFTFVATVAAICYTGATPVLVDVESSTLTMDARLLESAITPRTKVILPVHLYGQPADMDAIREVARHHKLTVIEDAAQAHGAEYKGKRVGSLGNLSCFSFYPGKNLGACGEGGIVVASNPEHVRIMKMLRDWGQEEKYHHILHGFNYRMEGIQGAVLRVKLRYLEGWTQMRRQHAAHYDRLLAASPVQIQATRAEARHVYHVYGILTDHRDALRKSLTDKHIHTGIHYPIPVHLQPAYAHLGYRPGDFPQAEKAAHEELSLPMFPELTDEQVRAVAAAVQDGVLAPASETHPTQMPVNAA